MSLLSGSLDLIGSAEAISSVYDAHPIRDAHPPESRGIPLLLSLCLTPLLVYGFSAGLFTHTPFGGVRNSSRTVPLSLDAWILPPDAPEPAQTLPGLREAGGAGHTEGTGTLDPNLADNLSPTLSRPTESIAPEAGAVAPRADQMEASLSPTLPGKVGGNGLVRGVGREASMGSGDLNQPLLRRVPLHPAETP